MVVLYVSSDLCLSLSLCSFYLSLLLQNKIIISVCISHMLKKQALISGEENGYSYPSSTGNLRRSNQNFSLPQNINCLRCTGHIRTWKLGEHALTTDKKKKTYTAPHTRSGLQPSINIRQPEVAKEIASAWSISF